MRPMALLLLKYAALLAALIALVTTVLSLRRPGARPLVLLLRREFRGPHSAMEVLLCLIAGVLLVILPIAWESATGQVAVVRNPAWSRAAWAAGLLTILVKIGLVLFEELAFRAALQTLLARYLPSAVTVAASALLFAAAHGRGWLDGAVLFVDGVGYGALYLLSGSLVAPVALHAAKNLGVWLLTSGGTIQFAVSPWRVEGVPVLPLPELLSAVLIVVLTITLFANFPSLRPAGR